MVWKVNWATGRPSAERVSGTCSWSGSRETTSPAAWVEAWRRDALDALGGIQQPADGVVFLVEALEFVNFVKRAANGVGIDRVDGNLLGHPVGQAVLHAEHAPDIANRGAGGQGAEGDDLGHVVGAEAADHVLDDFVAAVAGEVHVHVGHGALAADGEEALEDDVVLDGVDVRHAGGVGDEAAVHRAAGGGQHALVAREGEDFADQQQVLAEVGLVDDVEFVGQAFAVPGVGVRQATGQALSGQFGQVRLDRLAVRYLDGGHGDAAERQIEVAALGDGDGVGQRVGLILEGLGHFFGRLEVPLALHAHAVGVGHQAAGLDAEQDVVGVFVVGREVVDVVGGDERQAETAGELDESLGQGFLVGQTRALDLEVVVVGSEGIGVPAGDVLSAGQVAGGDGS